MARIRQSPGQRELNLDFSGDPTVTLAPEAAVAEGRKHLRQTIEIPGTASIRPFDEETTFGHFDPERFKEAYSGLITAYCIALQEAKLDPDNGNKKKVAEDAEKAAAKYLLRVSQTLGPAGPARVKALVASLNRKPKWLK